jgi:hypothetical protein
VLRRSAIAQTKINKTERTGDGTRALVATGSASSLVRCDGNGEILLVLQDLVRDAFERLRGVDAYRG